MKKHLFSLLIIVSIQANAQQDTLNTKSLTLLARPLILKTTPSYIFDFDNTFTLGIEKFVTAQKSINIELGYGNSNYNLLNGIFFDIQNRPEDFKNVNHFRSKLELKKYLNKYKNSVPEGTYFSVEAFGKYSYRNSFINVSRNTINFVSDFNEFVYAKSSRLVLGTHFKFGYQWILDSEKKQRWVMDGYGGLGARYIENQLNYSNKLPGDNFQQSNRMFGKIFQDTGSILIVSATAGFKLGFILK